MTFLLTAAHFEVGAWQLADARTTAQGQLVSDAWCKQVYFHCTDGRLLLGHTGVAEISPGMDTASWLCKQIDQITTVSQCLEILTANLNALWKENRRLHLRHPLIIHGASMVNGQPPAGVGITNVNDSGVCANFATVGQDMTNRGHLWGACSGAGRVPEELRSEIADLVERAHEFSSPLDVMGALAKANAHAALDPGVSPWCQVIFMPARIESFPAIMLHGRLFPPKYGRSPGWMKTVRKNWLGVDASDSLATIAEGRRGPSHGVPVTWTFQILNYDPA